MKNYRLIEHLVECMEPLGEGRRVVSDKVPEDLEVRQAVLGGHMGSLDEST